MVQWIIPSVIIYSVNPTNMIFVKKKKQRLLGNVYIKYKYIFCLFLQWHILKQNHNTLLKNTLGIVVKNTIVQKNYLHKLIRSWVRITNYLKKNLMQSLLISRYYLTEL